MARVLYHALKTEGSLLTSPKLAVGTPGNTHSVETGTGIVCAVI